MTVPVSLGTGTHSVSVTVKAENQAGSSTSATGSTSFRITGKPKAPSAPVAAANGTSQIRVTTPSTLAADNNGWRAGELEIEYRLVDSAGNQVKGWDDDNTSFSGLTPGATYYVEARVVVDDQESIASATVRSNAVTLPKPSVAVGTQKTFMINTSVPESTCTQQDLNETGFAANRCWKIVVDVSGFNPDSTVSCNYDYRDTADGQTKNYTGSFTVDSQGGGRHVFPHRSPNADRQITCTQQ
ncbi:hypothetical protein [Actinomyces sp. 432]|uniref:hypothetical protein n=1 Tax=Actinomyces sp. 432 TaxID=2057798 RepID=UPI001F3C3741|nr:hypothetical protein [Actinomyces sp. 432]